MTARPPELSCRGVEELLPWRLNATLSAAEADAVELHLARCPGCRAAWEATRAASAIFAAHPDPATLADYALGLPCGGPERAILEAHLAHCASCREEVALVGSEPSLAASTDAASPGASRPPTDTPAPVTRHHSAWTVWALAASLVLSTGLSAWLALSDVAAPPSAPSPTTPPRPSAVEGRVVLLELLPEDARQRGAGDEAALLSAAVPTTLVLVSGRAEAFAEVRAIVTTTAGGTPPLVVGGLHAAGTGAWALLLPPGALPPGPASIALEGRFAAAEPAAWEPIARYRIRVAEQDAAPPSPEPG
jgi:hypothetical protein